MGRGSLTEGFEAGEEGNQTVDLLSVGAVIVVGDIHANDCGYADSRYWLGRNV